MTNILLTPYSGKFLGPIAKVLGWIMNEIYELIDKIFNFEDVGLTIIILTIVIYTLLLPFTFKQQKFAKLSQKMQPEIKAIQEKYKNKKDQASQMAMSQETQMIYDKYGVSPMGSCVQMLIQMPIWLALYRVFYNVPAYIISVKEKFVGAGNIVEEIMQQNNYLDIMKNIANKYAAGVKFDVTAESNPEAIENAIVDVLYKLPSLDVLTKETEAGHFFESLESLSKINPDTFYDFNIFLGLNISDTPWNIIKESFIAQNYLLIFGALAIPIIYFFVQKVSMKLSSTTTDKKDDKSDMMAQQMNMLTKTMPLMMVFFCFITPVGLGIYWIVSSAYRVLQQVILNKYFDKMDLEKIIEKNKVKAAKKAEKRGIYENQIREAAAMKTRTLSNKASYDNSGAAVDTESKLEKANEMKSTAKAGSLSAKANMVRDYNERNSRK